MDARSSTPAVAKAGTSSAPEPSQRRLGKLTKRAEFLAAARAQKAVAKGLILQRRIRASSEQIEGARFGVTASKKVGNAIKRNLAKRRLRVLARDILSETGDPSSDYVLIARAGTTIERDFAKLRGDLEHALGRLPMIAAKPNQEAPSKPA